MRSALIVVALVALSLSPIRSPEIPFRSLMIDNGASVRGSRAGAKGRPTTTRFNSENGPSAATGSFQRPARLADGLEVGILYRRESDTPLRRLVRLVVPPHRPKAV